jgi:hypothetical protein
VAVCGNALLCDHCAPFREADARHRWGWHFADWTAGGGRLLGLRLSAPHRATTDIRTYTRALTRAFAALRRSAAWRDAGIVDWVRTIHARWSHRNGFNLHFHVTAFVHPKCIVTDPSKVEAELQASWRKRAAGAGFKRISGRHGLVARWSGSALRALYAWRTWDDDDDTDLEPEHEIDTGDFEPEHTETMSLQQMARAALEGDTHAYAAWGELCIALKGVPVTKASRTLDRIWAQFGPQPEPHTTEVDGATGVARVSAALWERGRRRDAIEAGLDHGQHHGVEALAQFWATRLGQPVAIDRHHSPPRLTMSQPPPTQGQRYERPSALRPRPGRLDHSGRHRPLLRSGPRDHHRAR